MHPHANTFPLVDSSYDNQEILRCIETLLSGQLTMGPKVLEFEKAFAAHVGAPFAVMVNSGSSANLLAVSAALNPVRSAKLQPGDYVVVPAVCWSTSVWPLVQLGLKPLLVDVDPLTLNLSLPHLERVLDSHPVKALMLVHVLGNATDMGAVLEIAKQRGLIVIEDTCESLGSTYQGTYLGALGDFGTFSFYFSHHMTTIEGGMVIAKTQEDYDLLRALRAHGWSREQSNREALERANPHIDPRFLFVNVGYNLRPMEIQGAFGLEQLKRLDEMNLHRRENTRKIKEAFTANPKWRGQLVFPNETAGLDACWFGFPFLVADSVQLDYAGFTQNLLHKNIDSRPIVSGNMALQPAVKLFDIGVPDAPLAGAQRVHDRGVFIGVHAKPLEDARIAWLTDTILDALGA